jgi:hypothetical protein
MMATRHIQLCILVLVCTATYAGNPNEYKGGTGEAVKNWGAKDYDQVAKSTMPLLIYITDEGFKTNQKAKLFENDLLGNADVKNKMKPFSQIRMDADGTRAKGWSKDWLNRGSNGSALLIISSDLRFPVWIDKGTPKEQLKPDYVLKSMQMVLDYETKKREAGEVAAKKDPKAPKEQAEEKPKEDQTKGFAGFLGDKEKDKNPFPPKDGKGMGKDAKDDKVAEKKADMPKKKKDEPLDE